MKSSDHTKVRLTYRDSADPGFVTMRISSDRHMMAVEHRLSIVEAHKLSQQLAEAVRASDYELVAQLRKARL